MKNFGASRMRRNKGKGALTSISVAIVCTGIGITQASDDKPWGGLEESPDKYTYSDLTPPGPTWGKMEEIRQRDDDDDKDAEEIDYTIPDGDGS